MSIFNYTVNYIDVAIVAVFVLLGVIGYRRGLLINLVNVVRFAVGLFLCFYFSENLTQPIYDGYVRERVLQSINEKIVTSGNVDEVLKNLNDAGNSLPAFVRDFVSFQSIDISSKDIAQSILTSVFEPLLLVLIKVAVFVIVFLLFFLSTGMIIHLVRRAGRKKEERNGKRSPLKKTDKAFGLLFGMMKAFVIVLAITSVFMYILSLGEDITKNSPLMNEVQHSTLVQLLDAINPFNAVTEDLV